MPDIIVIVEGGVVTGVSNIPPGYSVIVRDYDVQWLDDEES